MQCYWAGAGAGVASGCVVWAGTGGCAGAGAACCGMSEAVVALLGTAALDWPPLLATSDGEGAGAAGSGVACACWAGCGVTCACWGACVFWVVSALIRTLAASEAEEEACSEEADLM